MLATGAMVEMVELEATVEMVEMVAMQVVLSHLVTTWWRTSPPTTAMER